MPTANFAATTKATAANATAATAAATTAAANAANAAQPQCCKYHRALDRLAAIQQALWKQPCLPQGQLLHGLTSTGRTPREDGEIASTRTEEPAQGLINTSANGSFVMHL